MTFSSSINRALFILAIGIAFHYLLTPFGIWGIHERHKKTVLLQEEVKQLHAQIQVLQQNAAMLSGSTASSKEYLKNHIRQELGYVEKGEQVIWLPPLPHKTKQASRDKTPEKKK